MASARFDIPEKFPRFDDHHWADWVELCCIENIDGFIARKDMEKRVRLLRSLKNAKNDESILDSLPATSNIPDEEDADIEEDDATRDLVAGWFQHLAARVKFFQAAYPFTLNGDYTRLDIVPVRTDLHKFYLCLLMMANLHYFTDIEHALTSDFEHICREALRVLLPAAAEVHVFGKGRAATARYAGNVFERLKKLTEDLNGDLIAQQKDFPPTSTGDAGLDLIAWLPFEDPAQGRFAVFGQCACTPKWTLKQHTSAPQNWCEGKMRLQCLPINTVFTPYYLRGLDGKWHRPATDFGPYLHLDRLRLASILSSRIAGLVQLGAFDEADKLFRSKAEPL